ncbi:carboxypeptidase M32 [Pseudoalteromonas fenneropenaei]|uniref:Metal-dependent carboxypeptidase n=1 Tax=Pseudoalteromonas fenneropenaei TaxID=1737459 RepID=A0ABV7CG49_9GAMM
MTAYQQLVAHFATIDKFSHLAAICGWDQAAMMPSGGAQARSEAMAELAVHIHSLSCDPRIGDWLQAAQSQELSTIEQASVREMARSFQQATILPQRLVEAKAIAGAKCEHAWRTQRKNNDWQGFLINFQEVVALSREEAAVRASQGHATAYDAMLDLYEPGVTSQQLDGVFGDVKTWLPDFINTAVERQSKLAVADSHYPTSAQTQLGQALMAQFGFDFARGRLDVSVHPFCGGVSQDTRITTRYREDDFLQAMMGVIHETGHACYEQGLPSALAALPVGKARSMGIHESQSLFYEMQIARDSSFSEVLFAAVKQHLADYLPADFSVTKLQQQIQQVERGFIRVDADEVTYPAHVILRYEIERDLINGAIEAEHLPALWQEKMQSYLGLSTAGNYRDGCMQDIHWTDGSFGYFPSYTLGAMYAAQFRAAMEREFDVSKALQAGDLAPLRNWLDKNVWQQASLLETNELVRVATGEQLNPNYFKQHLAKRYLGQ